MTIRLGSLIGVLVALATIAIAAAWWLTGAPAVVAFDRAVVGVLADRGLSEPFGLTAAADGSLLVADAGTAHRIRRIMPDGTVMTLAGSARGFVDGVADRARFSTPSAIAAAADGTLYVADTGNHAIRRITPDGTVSTVAGDGEPGFADGPAGTARFDGPVGLALDSAGRVVVADTYNDRIRRIDADGTVRTLAGGEGPGLVDGVGQQARFDTPTGVAVDMRGRILVADMGNSVVRTIEQDGTVSTLATPGIALERPVAVATGAAGEVLIVDERGFVVRVPSAGDAHVLAGGTSGFADGDGPEARFRRPAAIAWLPPHGGAGAASRRQGAAALVVADAGNAMVRVLRPAGTPGRAATVKRVFAAMSADPSLGRPAAPRRPPEFDVEAFGRVPLLWPVAPLEGPHEVAGTFAEARGEQGQERFHAGLDVREEQGTAVRAVRDGTVASPIALSSFETLNEALRIGDVAYIHIRAGREAPVPRSRHADQMGRAGQRLLDSRRFKPVYDVAGDLAGMRVRRGSFFAAGDLVGTINRFNHVHLNVGWAGEEHNPLRFRLLQFADHIAPSIGAHGVRLFDESGAALNPDRVGPVQGRGRRRRPTRRPPTTPVVVRGRVRIVLDAWDQADGNASYRRLGLYALGYQVLDGNGAAVPGYEQPVDTIRFDRMPRHPDAARQVFAAGSGIPVYGAGRTRFLYVVTTGYRDGVATPGWWDTTRLLPGAYVLRVFGRDYSGNRATRDLPVLVAP